MCVGSEQWRSARGGVGRTPLQQLVDRADPLAAIAHFANVLQHRAGVRGAPDVGPVVLHATRAVLRIAGSRHAVHTYTKQVTMLASLHITERASTHDGRRTCHGQLA